MDHDSASPRDRVRRLTLRKIAIVGGGPAGLYLSILLKKSRPDIDVSVYEKNAPGVAFGFGVVFSDETLDNFRDADGPSYTALVNAFKQWGEIEVHHLGGRKFISGGHGFAAASRKDLLEILSNRASEVGVDLRFETDITEIASLDADLIVGADGVHSIVREALRDQLLPNVDQRANKYIWFGTPKVFERFNFIFKNTPAGMVWAHIYPYSSEGSTFIVEMAPETWTSLGLGANEHQDLGQAETDQASLEFCQDLFADFLDGQALVGNKSRWLQFPTISCERWHHGNVVLMGDAIHTAHFSVGSGTKLAMEDAISLANLLLSDQPIAEALVAYESDRRSAVDSLQRAAKASLEWFEGADRYRDLEPEQFVFSMLTRSQRVTYDNLRLRDPAYMKTVDR